MIIKLLSPVLAGVLLIIPAKPKSLNRPVELSIMFSISNAGFEVHGSIDAIESSIKFDPYDLENSDVKIIASPATIHTGISLRDKHLQKKDYFDTEKYPLIVMQSVNFKWADNKKLVGEFNLTVKNVTRLVTVPISATPYHSRTRYSGHFELNRLDFNVGEKSLILNDVVKVDVQIIL